MQDRKVTACPVSAGHGGHANITYVTLGLHFVQQTMKFFVVKWLTQCHMSGQRSGILSCSCRDCKHGVCHTDVFQASIETPTETVWRVVKMNCSLGVRTWGLQARMCACHSSFKLCVPCGPPGKPLAIGTVSQKIKTLSLNATSSPSHQAACNCSLDLRSGSQGRAEEQKLCVQRKNQSTWANSLFFAASIAGENGRESGRRGFKGQNECLCLAWGTCSISLDQEWYPRSLVSTSTDSANINKLI